MACNDDVRVSINGQLHGSAAVACSELFGGIAGKIARDIMVFSVHLVWVVRYSSFEAEPF